MVKVRRQTNIFGLLLILIMILEDFFSPVDDQNQEKSWISSQFGTIIQVHAKQFPDLDQNLFDIALIGIEDDRMAIHNNGCAKGSNIIRKKLYTLHEGNYKARIADLGNIKAGNDVSDTYFALKTAVSELVKKNIIPIILGGSQDLTYPQFEAYEQLDNQVDLVLIDSHFDLDLADIETSEINSKTYLNAILLHEPNYLLNLSYVGYQSYFVNQDSVKAMEQLYFDTHRLGELTGKIQVCEPILRNADLISFDIGAIRASDAPGNGNAMPNGFYGEEACQICRYAGMSDKLSSIGFYEYNPHFDQNEQTASLIAQMIWYFIEGFYLRKHDHPNINHPDYLLYRAQIKNYEHEIIFVKSKKSDRWWIQIPYPDNPISKNERYRWIPCTYEDYQTATDGEMPNIWWRTYQKLI